MNKKASAVTDAIPPWILMLVGLLVMLMIAIYIGTSVRSGITLGALI